MASNVSTLETGLTNQSTVKVGVVSVKVGVVSVKVGVARPKILVADARGVPPPN